ncbi:MAG: hypothetical protein V4694_01465 [Pseudomonadota bacterium]
MFKLKIQSKFTKLCAFFFLAIFIAGGSISLVHSFSHQSDVVSHEKTSGKAHDCYLCSFSSFQNQISLAPKLAFYTAFFFMVFALRKFNRVKLSYLLASKAPRAPPVIS